jgi:uncharacterized repeat protein (TIGR01451 family)
MKTIIRLTFLVVILTAALSGAFLGARAKTLSSTAAQLGDETSLDFEARDGVEPGRELVYLVRLQDPPLAAYRGEVSGLAATNPRELGQRKLDATSPASLAYRDYLLARQDAFLARLEAELGRKLEVRYRYYAANNGLALYLTAEEAARTRQMPEVIFIQPNFKRQLDTDVSNAWIGSTSIWDGSATGGLPGTKGEGIIVGVIDTGINPSNPSFADVGGDGYNHTNPWGAGNYVGVCDPADPSYDPTFPCNDKLIGAWGYAAVNGGDPRDYEGHGSHTASTAAGNAVTAHMVGHTISVDRQISGVAPHANIVAYAACCDGDALTAAIDQVVIDGVDVVNYSIGSAAPSDPWNDFDTVGFLNARDAGIYVSTSAGNRGPDPATTGSPADAPWLMSNAASSHNRKTTNVLMNMSGGTTAPPADIHGVSFTSGYGPAEIVYAGAYGDALCLNPFAGGTFSGQIVICDRGQNARVDKGANVQAGGAGGMILANDATNGSSLTSDDHYLPAVHITYSDGVTLKAWVGDGGASHLGTIRGTLFETNDDWGDIITDFSSRGPNRALGDILKPNITGPGEDVLAAAGVDDPSPAVWALFSGTSMASPHGAGAAALMMALHPSWTPDEIQSALQTTAWQEVLDYDHSQPDVFDMGSGRMDLNVAAKAGLVLNETRANYDAANPATGGDPSTLNLASLGKGACYQTCGWTRTLRSTVSSSVTWTIDAVAYNGLDLTVTPSSFTIPPGGTQTITVNADVRRAAPDTWAFGELRLTPSDANIPPAHLPVGAFAISSDNVDVLEKSANIDLTQVNGTIHYTITLTHKSLAAANYDLSDPVPANTSYVNGSATGGLTYNSGTNTLSWSGSMPAGDFVITEEARSGFISMGELGAPPATKPSNLDSGCLLVTLNDMVYFGTTYTDGVWSVNGTLQAGISPFCAGNTNGQVPSTSQPNGIIAPWWDDLDFTSGGEWYFVGVSWNGALHTVFSWENVPVKGTSDTASFQLWFEEGKDNMWFAYPAGGLPTDASTATVGAENSNGQDGATYYYNGTGTVPDGSTDLVLGPQPVVQTFGFDVTANAVPEALNQATLTQGATTLHAYDYTSIYQTNTWLGNSSSWGVPGNWSRGALPGQSDWVVIPGNPSGGQMPVLAADAAVFNLEVQPGASLDLGSSKLTVQEAISNQGALKQTQANLPANSMTEFLHLTNASGAQDKYLGLEITPTSGAMGSTSVQVKGGVECTASDPGDTVNRCYEITPGSAQTADVRFYYLDAERDGHDASLVKPWHWSAGSGWAPAGSVSGRGSLAPGYHWVLTSGVNAYSPFALSEQISGPTAVTLVSARAYPTGSSQGAILLAGLAVLAGGVGYWVWKRVRSGA